MRYFVIKQIGDIAPSTHIIREFESKEHAETFVDMLRASEKLEFVKYFIAQVIDYQNLAIMNEIQFKEFFNTKRLLDTASLKTGTKHIQLTYVETEDKNWLVDATYLGNNGKVYFLLSRLPDCNETKVVSFQEMSPQSIIKIATVIREMRGY